MGIQFRDERFRKGGFKEYVTDPRFVQRCLIEDGLIICETVTEASCTVEEALAEIRGPWDWWDHGKALDFKAGPDYNDQVLAPVAWFITRVRMRHFHAMPFEAPEFQGLTGHRVPVLLSKHFRGTATVDVFEKSAPESTVILRGRFHGVENHVPGAPTVLAAKMHLRAESGKLYWPFLQGTGFRGLLRRLESVAVRGSGR
jgi:hypothetical protein